MAVATATLAPMPQARPRRLDPQRLGDHVDRLFRAALALCGDRHDAEDLVQETYARVLSRPRFLHRDDDLGYLLRVLRNMFNDRLRSERRRPLVVDLEAAPDVGSRATDPRRPERGWEAHAVLAAVAALPVDQRDAVVAIDVVGLSYAEAARSLRVKEATLTTRLHRGRRRVVATIEGTDDREGEQP